VAYGGVALNSSTIYKWSVTTTTASCTSEPSELATFVTSLYDGWLPGASFLTTNISSYFGYFRKEITVPPGVVSAVAHVTAVVDDKLLSGYKFYINDKLIDLGPGRGEAPVWDGDGLFRSLPYATLDVTPSLTTPGTAVIALQTMHNPPKVIFQVTMLFSSGEPLSIITDNTWGAFNGDLHRKPGPATHGGSAGTGFLEYIDARGEPVGWRAPGFIPNASLWGSPIATLPTPSDVAMFHAHMKPPLEVSPMTLASIRPVPPPAPPAPSKPVACGIVEENSVFQLACPDSSPISDVAFASFGTPGGYCPGHLSKGDCDATSSLSVLKNACTGKKVCNVTASSSTFGGDPCYNVKKSLAVELKCPGSPPPPSPPPSQPSSFIGDFGVEFQGGLTLQVRNGTAGDTVSIACGEMLQGDSVGYTWGWEFVWTLRDGEQTLEQHKYMECRFVSLLFSSTVDFTLSGWRVNYPWYEEDSSFSSSNDTLNAVYNLCRYTVHSAALDTYTDSNTRERTPYEADGIIAATGRIMVQRDVLFPRHSHSFVLEHPTWPTEWRQASPFLGWQVSTPPSRELPSTHVHSLLTQVSRSSFLGLHGHGATRPFAFVYGHHVRSHLYIVP